MGYGQWSSDGNGLYGFDEDTLRAVSVSFCFSFVWACLYGKRLA